ncbi:ABC transporter substrate-binding protein [Mesotoga prima]|uniref:ABC transporter substrate-binding protein n=1 Tax=Mesotoga prima TaxID=1184387 RepID=UPI002FE3A2D2
MKKLALVIAVILVFVLAFATPEYVIEDFDGKPGGILNLVLSLNPVTLNMYMSTDVFSSAVINLCQAELFSFNLQNMLTVPELATNWWISDDGLTAFFRIRQGILWSDGEPFTIEDVFWSFTEVRFKEGMTARGNVIYKDSNDQLPVVEVLDEKTISFTWTAPVRSDSSCFRITANSTIMPKHALEEAVRNGTFATSWTMEDIDEYVSIGPFIPVEYESGVKVVLERNPNYWKFDSKGVKLPYLDGVVFHILGSVSERLQAFESGTLDFFTPNGNDFPSLLSKAADNNWIVGRGGLSNGIRYIVFNFNAPDPVKRGWFRNDHFRRAFAYLVDRQEIIDTVYGGLAEPVYVPIDHTGLYTSPETDQLGYPYSVENAKLEFQKGGFSWNSEGKLIDQNGNLVQFDLDIASTGIAAVVYENAREVGIELNRIQYTGVPPVRQALYDAALLGTMYNLEPCQNVNAFRIDGPSHVWNFPVGYREHITEEIYNLPEWEKRIHEIFLLYAEADNDNEKAELTQEFLQLFAEYLPYVYLFSENILYARQGNVHFPNPFPTTVGNERWKAWGIWKE